MLCHMLRFHRNFSSVISSFAIVCLPAFVDIGIPDIFLFVPKYKDKKLENKPEALT